ncbi:MAG: hypothetical protein ACP5L5_08725, partial [Vulcanisaeta sp.]|uniref:hypothetical protein n=1 Tax=Vulcanisaeta sp. TaxID=2020871 RepID=UPI003D113A0A
MQSQHDEETTAEPWVYIHALTNSVLTEHMQELLSKDRQGVRNYVDGNCAFNIQLVPPGTYALPRIYRQFSSINLERLVAFITSV